MYRLMIVSLGKTLSTMFSNEDILNFEIEEIMEKILEPKVQELVQERPDLIEICKSFGLWVI